MKNVILAARGDAIGERLCCLLNAMFISKKTDLNFGFVWAQTPKIENNTQNSLVIKMASDLYKYNQEDFFSQDFIKQYSYKDVFNLGNGNFSKFKNQSIKNMNDKALYQNSWGYYCVQDELDVYFNDIDDYRECIRLCWNEIKFSCKIQKIINSAYDLLISNFIAIHVRGGDALYDLREVDCYIGAFKFVPLELAISIIKNTSKNKNIILFGDDISSNCKIKEYCSDNKVFLIDDFFDRTSMDSVEQAIFEMVVMSRAEVIYSSGGSGFSRLAFLIGLSKKVYLLNISYKDRYFNILHYIDDFYANNFQKAFSYLYLFLISRELNYDYETQIGYLEKSKTQDSKNNVYKVLLSDLYIKNGSCDKLIELLHNVDHKFFNIFFKRGFSTQKYLAYDFVFKSFLKNEFNGDVINYIKYLIVCKFFNREIPLSCENQFYA
ncbi:O-fucosyltransferase family protein, partial [Campylobacter volucris]